MHFILMVKIKKLFPIIENILKQKERLMFRNLIIYFLIISNVSSTKFLLNYLNTSQIITFNFEVKE